MKKFLIHIYIAIKNVRENFRVSKSKSFNQTRLEARIIRYLHAIEKGLSLEKPRTCFGAKKIKTIFNYVEEYISGDYDNKLCLYMARDAIKEYLDFHFELNVENEEIKTIKSKWQRLNDFLPYVSEKFGGITQITRDEMNFSFAYLWDCFLYGSKNGTFKSVVGRV